MEEISAIVHMLSQENPESEMAHSGETVKVLVILCLKYVQGGFLYIIAKSQCLNIDKGQNMSI